MQEVDLKEFTEAVVRDFRRDTSELSETMGEEGGAGPAEKYLNYTDQVAAELGILTARQVDIAVRLGRAIHKSTEKIVLPSMCVERFILSNLVANQTLALWYLIESGQLDSETAAFLKSSPGSREDEVAVRIAQGYLEQVALRNRSAQHYNNPYLPPIGLEAEFILSGSYPKDLLDDVRDAAGLTGAYHIIDKPASLLDIGAIRYGAYGYYREVQEASGTKTVGEIVQHPAPSPAIQLRQLMYLIKTGIISPGLGLHINISGVKLDYDKLVSGESPVSVQSHTEAMTISTVIAACGYMAKFYKTGTLGAPMKEAYAKLSDDGNYYPLHKSRAPKNYYKGSFNKHSVEYRGIGAYTSFPNMVKAVESTYWLSVAAVAKQRAEEPGYDNDAINQKLAQEWDAFEQEWVGFLQHSLKPGVELSMQESIDQLTSYAQTVPYPASVIRKHPATPYNKAFGVIVSLAETNQTFRHYSRNLMIRHRARIKAIIDESEKPKPTVLPQESVESIVG